jgi:hypothetical protein
VQTPVCGPTPKGDASMTLAVSRFSKPCRPGSSPGARSVAGVRPVPALRCQRRRSEFDPRRLLRVAHARQLRAERRKTRPPTRCSYEPEPSGDGPPLQTARSRVRSSTGSPTRSTPIGRQVAFYSTPCGFESRRAHFCRIRLVAQDRRFSIGEREFDSLMRRQSPRSTMDVRRSTEPGL